MSGFSANLLEAQMLKSDSGDPEIPVFKNLPIPLNYRILVFPREIPNESKGGLAIPDETIEAMKSLRGIGKILAMGPKAFEHPDLSSDPVPKVDDWVLLPKHAGEWTQHGGVLNGVYGEYMIKIVRDADVLAVYEHKLIDVMGM